MTDTLELQHTYSESPERMREVLTDPEYLRAKLREVGGQRAELVSRDEDEDGTVTVVQRQSVPADSLPSFAQSLVPGDVTIERTETWTGPGGGPVNAVVVGTPAKISGTMTLRPHRDGVVFALQIQAKVPIPLFSIAVEKMITKNIADVMEVEYRFTQDWLARP
ncbi:MAG: DUF2505 family protein [Pseudonocardiaceae bacterium]|nr:DUF2505 family protein [Pseudonocardiaceae bacterium]